MDSIDKKTLTSSWGFVSSGLAMVLGLLSWLIVILYVIFIMLDYERIMLGFRQLVPARHRRRTFKVASDIKNAMNRYFRGQFVIASIVGVLFAIGFLIIGLPMGVVLGLFIGLLNMVPYLQLISLPVTAVLCIVCTASTGVDFWVIFWESMAVYIVVQCIQDLFLTPRIMGKAMGLNPAIILLSLSIWGSLLGFMGLIVALPSPPCSYHTTTHTWWNAIRAIRSHLPTYDPTSHSIRLSIDSTGDCSPARTDHLLRDQRRLRP